MSTTISPTFLLKQVDPSKILRDYKEGYFSREKTQKTKIKISNNTITLAPSYGINSDSPVYCVKDKHNSNVIMTTSGHSSIEMFKRTGGELPLGGRCDYCKCDFDTVAVGYPIASQESTFSFLDAEINENRHYVTYSFWVEGEFCSFECAGGYVKMFTQTVGSSKDSTMRDSYGMLQNLYGLTYGESKPLIPAQDPRLLKRGDRGGSLTMEEWKDTKHPYIRTDRVVMIPAGVEYFRSEFASS